MIRRSIFLSLMLTPMVDMFSLLVIFLLQVFSATPETLVPNPSIQLPFSASATEFKDAPAISVTPDAVYLDQKLIGPLKEIAQNPEPLLEALDQLRKDRQKGGAAFASDVQFVAHKEIPSSLIARIVASLPSVHFGTVHLMSIQGKGGSS